MRRAEFEHVLFAAADVSDASELVVIGSQALLGSIADPPSVLVQSMEADVFVPGAPDKSDLIDGAIGDGSPFWEMNGYYAHGVGRETLIAPRGWEERLVSVRIPPRGGSRRVVTARCLEPHDLVLAKCAAGRDRDWEYAWATIDAGIADLGVLIERAATMPLALESRDRIAALLSRRR